MAVYTAYFDSSGQPYSTKVLSVAGFIADPEQWIRVQQQWEEVLSRYQVTSLHMKHYAHFIGEYASWRGDGVKQKQFLSELIAILESNVRHSFACSIDLVEYERVDKELNARKILSPLALTGGRCVANVRKWARSNGIHLDSTICVFEDGDVDKGNLTTSVERDFGVTPIFQKKGNSSALQAADLIAFEQRLAIGKMIEEFEGCHVELKQLRKSLQRIYKIPHFVGKQDSWVMFEKPQIEAGFRRVIAMRQNENLKP